MLIMEHPKPLCLFGHPTITNYNAAYFLSLILEIYVYTYIFYVLSEITFKSRMLKKIWEIRKNILKRRTGAPRLKTLIFWKKESSNKHFFRGWGLPGKGKARTPPPSNIYIDLFYFSIKNFFNDRYMVTA